MIPFNRPLYTGNEDKYVTAAMRSAKMSGDGEFGQLCHRWFEEHLGCAKALLTPSCTHALEMAAILINIQPGDEVIMPSYTFVSTANAFIMRGAKVIFVDVRPDTMNIDETLIEAAVTDKTRAIVPVHYAGVGCEMDAIMAIATRHGLYVIEDAAQGMMSTYKGKPLGTIGHLGTYSFHETKNYTSGGEGGLLIINDTSLVNRAEIIREKGTNRGQFWRGMVDKYTWVDIGSSYLPSELQAAYLYGQLLCATEVNEDRLRTWKIYYEAFAGFIDKVELPSVPESCVHNAHMFYIKLKNLGARTKFIEGMKARNVMTVFHYVPLHSSPCGKRCAALSGVDKFTTSESEKLVRLPMWGGMLPEERNQVIRAAATVLAEI
ncbi:dTDP-4-amino-4,6-dideoxygalactose transaminase [Pseudomonas psychrophila]|uniref:dTDP-4-amino-4,6-dideoxygalactose transaminase n=1 Tax=Pseudomonas psychrophila TaxID=122355 RepID=A0ABY0VT41_9PSED|nr:dTDP-4-amino-4,6-dideoxygalactose transaminase [Pseudomonas psychrophila]KAB0487724.1 dTDP-4-amino-4,6-dideoxygalactose transaminase [Pseudomonas psychrophila]KMM97274.1 TDP-4-oxo-6-deoxy-D-glucose aminotransferase [Pseudomonas psychrophila]QIE32862.1 dTDP-4-amino-4,6-dideoxygalactose transaminase [Pseudomonas psychrophila]WVI99413.1 dTDP-4-amino-4,6-dideoxygalactose transaminase [Pseudomonas psychrophila]SDU53919.1 dTDP-4-amino-4,6-dideoxygalactose transaminase [Pseudomonas psychrophila]